MRKNNIDCVIERLHLWFLYPYAFADKFDCTEHAERISVRIRTEVSDKCDCTEHAERISVRIRTEVLLSSYGYDMQTSSVCIGTVISKQ